MEEDVEEVDGPHNEGSVFDGQAHRAIAVTVNLQAQEVAEEHHTEDQREEARSLHDLEMRGVVVSILKDVLEVYLVGGESIGVPGHAPEVEDEQADSSEHGEDVVHGVD